MDTKEKRRPSVDDALRVHEKGSGLLSRLSRPRHGGCSALAEAVADAHDSIQNLARERIEAVTRAILPCTECGGKGYLRCSPRGTPHYMPCKFCCKHDQGWRLLADHFGDNNGRWCCSRGCGFTISAEEKLQRDAIGVVSRNL